MENREEEVYQKHRYQINIRECADEIIKNLRNAKNPSLLNITIEEYESRLNDAIEAYKDSINFDTIKSETKKRQAYVISVNHPSFNFWLAHFLAFLDSNKIKLVLDEYYFGAYGEINDFVNVIQYLVMSILEKIPLDLSTNIKELISWCREMKKESSSKTSVNETNGKSRQYEYIKRKSKETKLIKFDEKLQIELQKIIDKTLSFDEDKDSLAIALEGYLLPDENKIKINISISRIVDMFARIKTTNNLLIISSNKDLSKWICHNFLFYNFKRKTFNPTSIAYCEGVFSNKNRPQKNKRLPIDDLVKNCSDISE
jgi:hypothetical protein